jgi:hypothetical protein
MLFRVFLLVSFFSPYAFADFPMIRFWRGYAQDTATRDGFRKLINEKLIPETIEVGSRQAEDERGLLFYSPFMPSWNTAKRFRLPEEMAILVYKSTDHYDRIRQTERGKLYGPLHFIDGLFAKEPRQDGKASGSLVAKPFTKVELQVRDGKTEIAPAAYFLGKTPVDWQRGFGLVRILAHKAGYASAMNPVVVGQHLGRINSPRGQAALRLSYAVVAVEKDRLIEYLVFPTQRSRSRAIQTLRVWNEPCYSELNLLRIEKEPFGRTFIRSGMGVNVGFDPGLSCPTQLPKSEP